MSGSQASSPFRATMRPVAGTILWVAVLQLAGCSTGPGGFRFTLFPEGHRLSDTAKDMRAAYPSPQPLPRELDKRPAPLYTVEPGDVLLVQPVDLDSPVRFPGDQPVLPDGTINLGHYGLLMVAGKTVPEIEAQVWAQINAAMKAQPAPKEPRDPSDRRESRELGPITVRIVTRQSKVYYVLGDVNAPGSFNPKGNETVLDGILSAGGLTERASRKNIVLIRPSLPGSCRIVLPICWQDIVQLGDTSSNYQLAAGDRIYVSTRAPGESCVDDKKKKKNKDCPLCNSAHAPCPALSAPANGCGYHIDPPVPVPTPLPEAPAQLLLPRKEGPTVTSSSPESSAERR
jgi:polysaccharide biosynthesis/export protein